MKPRRYQLNKEAAGVVMGNHPWIFRDQLSSAASIFSDGDWLRLVGGKNELLGYGIYEATGAIAVRVFGRDVVDGKTAPTQPDAAWLRRRLETALAKRSALVGATTGIRLLNGESDGVPGVVADRYGETIVVTSYSAGSDALARYAACAFRGDVAGRAKNVVLRPAHRRQSAAPEARVMRGSPPAVAEFVEDTVTYSVDLEHQKTGAYLDLRGLRRAIASMPLAGKKVLNTFAYTGMLSRAAELAGAASIVSVDQSERALQFARAHHASDPAKHELVVADVFDWLPMQWPQMSAAYDLVIVDPPAMTSRKTQVPAVLAGYTKLYRAAAKLVRPGGLLVAACCTSRITRPMFRDCVAKALETGFSHQQELATEPDHPVGFPQADYLKISLWRRD